MEPTEYDVLDTKYEDDEELAEREYGEFVEWLIDRTAAELQKAHGDIQATRQALTNYYGAGFKANLSGAELVDFLCVSSECVLERAQLSDDEWDAALAINDSPDFRKEIGQEEFSPPGRAHSRGDIIDRTALSQLLAGAEVGDLVANLAQSFLPPPEQGTPNDEPVMRWAIRQYGKFIASSPEMARRLSAIGHPFLENFYVDKFRALKIYAADFEKAFDERPEIIINSFGELAKIYEEKGDESAASFFKERLADMPKSQSSQPPATVPGDLGFPGMRIFIPTEYADIARNLHHMIWREIEERQIHFKELQFSVYESCKAQPRREFSRISLCGRDQDAIEEIALKYLCDFDWPEPPFVEKEGKIDVWQRPADKPVPTSQPAEVESPYGRISSLIDAPVETSKYFHAIGFASFVWSEVFQPAMKQRNETGNWPEVDDELLSALTAVFDSESISQAAQTLGTSICDWRDRTIAPKPEQEQAGAGMVDALSLLGKLMGNSAMEQVSESMIMRTGVAGEIDPFYVWSFYVATDLWRANVQPSCFQRFCDLHYSNLYAADHFNVCRMADLLPEVVHGENIGKDSLCRQINNLSRLLKETSLLAASGETLFCHSFGAEAAPILAGYSVAMADLAKRI